jgi:hypothetical protein
LQEVIKEINSIGGDTFCLIETKTKNQGNAILIYVCLNWSREIGKSKGDVCPYTEEFD